MGGCHFGSGVRRGVANGGVGEKADERSEWPRRAVEQPEQGDGPGTEAGSGRRRRGGSGG